MRWKMVAEDLSKIDDEDRSKMADFSLSIKFFLVFIACNPKTKASMFIDSPP